MSGRPQADRRKTDLGKGGPRPQPQCSDGEGDGVTALSRAVRSTFQSFLIVFVSISYCCKPGGLQENALFIPFYKRES